MPRVAKDNNLSKRRRAPATTIEASEDRMASLAMKLAEKQLLDGTASPSVITHFLKMASTKERLEKEKLEKENELLKAKTESLQSAKRVEELYQNALNAMRTYRGERVEDDEDE